MKTQLSGRKTLTIIIVCKVGNTCVSWVLYRLKSFLTFEIEYTCDTKFSAYLHVHWTTPLPDGRPIKVLSFRLKLILKPAVFILHKSDFRSSNFIGQHHIRSGSVAHKLSSPYSLGENYGNRFLLDNGINAGPNQMKFHTVIAEVLYSRNWHIEAT